jgi:hypothetical protein
MFASGSFAFWIGRIPYLAVATAVGVVAFLEDDKTIVAASRKSTAAAATSAAFGASKAPMDRAIVAELQGDLLT